MTAVTDVMIRRLRTPFAVAGALAGPARMAAGGLARHALDVPAKALNAGFAVGQHFFAPPAEAIHAPDVFDLPPVVEAAADHAPPGAVLAHDELPLDDFDHLTLGQLRSRLRSLDAVALVQLRDYEHTHADRLAVMTMLETRLAKLTEPQVLGAR